MKKLYNQIMSEVNEILYIDYLIENIDLVSKIRSTLINNGYEVQGRSDRQVVILFFALNDIIYIYEDSKYYMATMCSDIVSSINKGLLNRLTTKNINKNLKDDKFSLIKLSKTDRGIVANASGTYPYLGKCQVFTRRNIIAWYSIIAEANKHNRLTLMTASGENYNIDAGVRKEIIDEYYLFSYRGILKKIPVWNIIGFQILVDDRGSNNDLVKKLQTGVVLYNKMYLTLNYNILENYYGNIIYSQLESKNVRMILCLNELKSSSETIKNLMRKYNIDAVCSTKRGLKDYLEGNITYKKEKPNIIHPRVLTSLASILGKYKSYITTIDLNKIKDSDYEVVTDIELLYPQTYSYYAISETLGYSHVDIKTNNEKSALRLGKTEFERQFGTQYKFCGLMLGSNLIKGIQPYMLSINTQHELWRAIRWGYRENFSHYSSYIKEICKDNNLIYSDNYVKYLYINNLARIKGNSKQLTLIDVVNTLLDFLTKINSRENAERELELEKIRIKGIE